jgi:hypothetical protein
VEQRRARALWENYGLKLEDYRKMHESQGGNCLICGQPETVVRRGKLLPLSVDHKHLTHTDPKLKTAEEKLSRVRGLLCHKCNSAVALMDRFPWWGEKAAAYLKRFDK